MEKVSYQEFAVEELKKWLKFAEEGKALPGVVDKMLSEAYTNFYPEDYKSEAVKPVKKDEKTELTEEEILLQMAGL